VLQEQWEIIDAKLRERHRQHYSPEAIHADGYEMVWA